LGCRLPVAGDPGCGFIPNSTECGIAELRNGGLENKKHTG
jgi:hypothetical protein